MKSKPLYFSGLWQGFKHGQAAAMLSCGYHSRNSSWIKNYHHLNITFVHSTHARFQLCRPGGQQLWRGVAHRGRRTRSPGADGVCSVREPHVEKWPNHRQKGTFGFNLQVVGLRLDLPTYIYYKIMYFFNPNRTRKEGYHLMSTPCQGFAPGG